MSEFTPNLLSINTQLGFIFLTARAPLLGREAVIEVWISDDCIQLRPAEGAGGGGEMLFSPMCFCPHCRFHSCLVTLGGPTNKVICLSPTVLCLSLLSVPFSAELLNVVLYCLCF